MGIDTILGILGTLLGVVGLITGYIFYRKSLKVKSPLFLIKSNNLIQDNITSISGLGVTYKGIKVQNLTVTRILFWNDGSDTIDNNDLVIANPLRIVGKEDCTILSVNVLESNNPSSKFSARLNKKENCVTIDFDYLDRNQGAVVQVFHSGKNSTGISIVGDIKGAKIQSYKRNGFANRLLGGLAM